MGKLERHSVPEGLEEPAALEGLLRFLNSVPTLEPSDSLHVYNIAIVEREGRYLVLDGDQLFFTADTFGEVHSFVCGLVAATYWYLSQPVVAAHLVREEPSDTP